MLQCINFHVRSMFVAHLLSWALLNYLPFPHWAIAQLVESMKGLVGFLATPLCRIPALHFIQTLTSWMVISTLIKLRWLGDKWKYPSNWQRFNWWCLWIYTSACNSEVLIIRYMAIVCGHFRTCNSIDNFGCWVGSRIGVSFGLQLRITRWLFQVSELRCRSRKRSEKREFSLCRLC